VSLLRWDDESPERKETDRQTDRQTDREAKRKRRIEGEKNNEAER
jgi:hypothetical protein